MIRLLIPALVACSVIAASAVHAQDLPPPVPPMLHDGRPVGSAKLDALEIEAIEMGLEAFDVMMAEPSPQPTPRPTPTQEGLGLWESVWLIFIAPFGVDFIGST